MLKLKSLKHSNLTENVLKILSQNRITTVLELLREDADKLSLITKLSLPQILCIRNHIFEKYSAPMISGITLLEKSLNRNKFLSTGIKSIDAILNGGIPLGFITEVCGLAGAGKTQLCLQLAINCVKATQNTVLYIDTKGDFSAVKVQKLLECYKLSHKEMAQIMFQIKIVHMWIMEEVLELLRKIKNNIIVFNKLSLIIIDSLPCLMFQYLGDTNKIGLALLNTFVNYCRFLCNELNLSFVCVNTQTRWIDLDVTDLEDEKEQSTTTFQEPTYIEKQNRCLGKYWQGIPALILLLERSQFNDCGVSKITLSLLRSFGGLDKQCIFSLDNFPNYT